MKGFIVYPTYKIENNSAKIYLFGRLENGESFLAIKNFRPYFCIKEKDLEKAKKIKDFDSEKTKLKNFDNEPVVKVILNIPNEVPPLRKQFEEKGIACYEADIRFAYRFLMDNEILSSVELKGEYTKGKEIDRLYKEPEISPCEFSPELNILSIDIETDGKGKHLYSIALYSKKYKKVLIVSDKKLDAETFPDEKSLLLKFKEIIFEQDPDIITGWNVINFDFKFLRDKFNEHKIEFRIGRIDWENKLRIESEFFRSSSAEIPGRMVLDGIHLLKISFIKLDDYKLGTAAAEFLGEKKLIQENNKVETIENYYKNEPQKLIEYNLKDAELVYKILEKTGVIDLTILRSSMTGMPLDRVNASIASFDSLYLRELRKRNYVSQSLNFTEKENQITGGFVMKSKPGIYNFVIVCDFKSLYPSIIRTFNIDPFQFVINKNEKGDFIVAPNGAQFRREDGILPLLIEKLSKERDFAKTKKDKLSSNAIKILMNSFFGVLASPNCRFFSMDISNAITYFGRMIIKESAKKIEEDGYDVIYGDTDSIFIRLDVENIEQAKKNGLKIQEKINSYFKNYIKEEYKRESYLELQFEKLFRKFLMPQTRNTGEGSKKRYAGLLVEGTLEKMDFTGLEFVRRDWTELAKKFQLELLIKIFHDEEVIDYVKTFIEDLKKGKYDRLLLYKRAIRKNLGEYTKITPPHVKAARKQKTITSNIIEYYMTTEGPEPAEALKHKIDYDHYIEKQVKPLADSVLVFYGKNFDDILNKQKNLFDY